jgi:predicted lactoylglutathione lyase
LLNPLSDGLQLNRPGVTALFAARTRKRSRKKEINMTTKIFVNLPVKNLKNSIEFFTKLGYEFNPQFTDETAACMVVAGDIFVMLLTHEKFKTFTPKAICDATKSTEVLVCLSCESREGVDELVHKAVAAGGTTYNEPQDHGFMYGHGFQDLDGHIWELVYMVPGAISQG